TAVALGHEIGQAARCNFGKAPAHLGAVGRLLLEGAETGQHMVAIDLGDRRAIGGGGRAQREGRGGRDLAFAAHRWPSSLAVRRPSRSTISVTWPARVRI